MNIVNDGLLLWIIRLHKVTLPFFLWICTAPSFFNPDYAAGKFAEDAKRRARIRLLCIAFRASLPVAQSCVSLIQLEKSFYIFYVHVLDNFGHPAFFGGLPGEKLCHSL